MVVAPLFALCLVVARVLAQSCEGRCGDAYDPSEECQCNPACLNHHDCCSDYAQECGDQDNSCKEKCGASYDPSLPCQCNSKCGQYSNCCPDYDDECGDHSGVTDADLLVLGQLLLNQDDSNVAGRYELDPQCHTNQGNQNDCSPLPLFKSVDPAVLDLPVYKKLAKLYDNYNKKPEIVEDHTEEEQEEENEFLDEVLSSQLMNTTFHFLSERGAFTGSWSDWGRHCYDTWFGLYDRAKRDSLHLSPSKPSHSHPNRSESPAGGQILGSSGFEHVFVGEVKRGEVGGFHNWFHFYILEKQGHINYLGHWEKVTLGEEGGRGGHGMSFTFTWDGVQKPYGSAFIGTSPSLELALYTTCLLVRPDTKCHVVLGEQDVYIQTWRESVGSHVYVGSSYPDWKL